MSTFHSLAGVYAAAVTPLQPDFSPSLDDTLRLLDFLAQRGCHGALLFGTTGEGPSFAQAERHAVLQAARSVRQAHPAFRLLAGTGTPSLEETVELTRAAFDLGCDGVVTLPPYYFRKVSDDGLFAWYSQVLRRAVPQGGAFFGYHIPAVSGVGLSFDLLARLRDAFPDRFAGIKDSTGDPEHARLLGERFGRDLVVLTGHDRLLTHALSHHASGCITAMANVTAPLLRQVYDAFTRRAPDAPTQARLEAYRAVMDRYPPAPALYKGLLSADHGFPAWSVRPPLLPLPPETLQAARDELALI